MNLRPIAVLALLAVTTLVALTLGVTGAPLTPDPSEGDVVRAATVPEAGGSVCVTGGGADDPVDLLLLAAPAGVPGAAVDAAEAEDASDVAARGVVLTLGTTPSRVAVGPVEPGELDRLEAVTGADGWLWTGWADRPVAAWQEWRTPGAPGEPRGVVASACLPADPRVQTLLGMRTDGGFEALVRLANPFEADATFAVTLVTEAGVVEPVALRNVSVPGGERVTVRLNDHVPEQPAVAAVVTVGAGRLAVEGLQRSIAAVGGIEGVVALPPITAPSTTWTFPWVPAGPDVDGAVWVLNPEPRPVAVGLTVHTPQGATVPQEERIEIAAGALARIDTADLVPDAARSFGLTLRSETTGVMASVGAAFVASEPERTGLVGFAGAPVPDVEWSVAGAVVLGRETVLHVVNLDEQPASVRVTLTTLRRATQPRPVEEGGEAEEGEDAEDAEQRPAVATGEERSITVLTPGTLAPGATLRIPLPVDGAGAFSAVVDGGRGLVVSRTTVGRDLLEPVAIAAVPSSAWRATGPALTGRAFDRWVASLPAPGEVVD